MPISIKPATLHKLNKRRLDMGKNPLTLKEIKTILEARNIGADKAKGKYSGVSEWTAPPGDIPEDNKKKHTSPKNKKTKKRKSSKRKSRGGQHLHGGRKSRRKSRRKHHKTTRSRKTKRVNKKYRGGGHGFRLDTNLKPIDNALANPIPISTYNTCGN